MLLEGDVAIEEAYSTGIYFCGLYITGKVPCEDTGLVWAVSRTQFLTI